MKTLRYWTTHPYGKGNPQWAEIFELDPARFEFVYDDRDPDYLMGSEQLFTDPAAMAEFVRLYDPRRVLIFYAGECLFPDMNLFDYAVSFDRHFSLGDRVIRRPNLSFFHNSVFSRMDAGCANPDAELRRKTGFCNFIYSNPTAHPRRDQIFHLLSAYKRVDSLGPHLNNCGNRTTREATDWQRQSVDMKSSYKFSIASENAVYPGYVSEKIISSFQAHTVPIYFGDPTIAEEFNPKAFINANGLSDAELLAAVRRVDGNDALWKAMVSEPPMTLEQMEKSQRDDAAYRSFWNRVFSMDPAEAKRAPSGTWPNGYVRKWLTRAAYAEAADRKAAADWRRCERMAGFAARVKRLMGMSHG